jgi:hypothetical protein
MALQIKACELGLIPKALTAVPPHGHKEPALTA